MGASGADAHQAVGARLDALDAAAVGLLEPLIAATDLERMGAASDADAADGAQGSAGLAAASGWRGALAAALDRLAAAARALDLAGLVEVVGLLRAHLLGVARCEDGALELASAEGWVSDAIALCGGQMSADEAGGLVERLRDWPGLSARVGPELVAPIVARLREDAAKIATATLADLRAAPSVPAHGEAARPAGAIDDGDARPATPGEAGVASVAVGADELAMLAEAAGQLDEEFAALIEPSGQTGTATSPAPLGADDLAEALEAGADAIERYANAIGYVGLALVAAALETLSRNLLTLARDPGGFDARHRALLARLAPAWAQLFREPAPQAAAEALALLGEAAWPVPARRDLLDGAQRQLGSLETVASRRVSAADQPIDERDLSLEIPSDADRDVVANLLRELPMLSADFAACVDRVHAGASDALAAAQRIAHTLKGSANTVGVRGIAVLTHQLEDLLQLLEPTDAALSPELDALLGDAADCLAEMSESVAGLGPAPTGAFAVLQRVRDWTNRLLQDPAAAFAGTPASSAACLPAEAAASVEPLSAEPEPAGIASAGLAPPGQPTPEPAPDSDTEQWLRVPASLIERLLAFANEASILLSQAQERALEVDRVRATLRSGTDQLQDLAGELERLVDIRGLALSERRAREDFDALELDEYNDLHMVSRRIAESGDDGRLIEQQLGGNVAALRDSLSQLERIQVDLREAALRTRTVRVDTVVPRWRRTVRQAARMAGHEVALRVDGGDPEIDAQLLQALVEPIAHLLRNAVDHGIEAPAQRHALGKPAEGCIVLALAREGADLIVDCVDDGRGLDARAVRERAVTLGLLGADEPCDDAALAQLVLVPGFSTRARATQLSGRGIGLDVVNQAVREQRGSLDIESAPGHGMRVRLRVPVRLAAVPVILVRSPSNVVALSVRDVEQVLSADRIVEDADGVRRFHGTTGLLRLVRLEDALGLPDDAFAPPAGVEPAAPAVLQVRLAGGERVAVLVAEPGQTRSVVVRPLAWFMPAIPGVEGAAVLGDGAVAPVVDLPQLLAARAGVRAAPALGVARRAAPVCLVVDDSVSVRRTMELFARDLGYAVDSAADGVDALECVGRRTPSLVLVDLEMPRMNGVELVRALRERPATRTVPVIMITSRSSQKHRRLALEAGVDVFLTKPYTDDALAAHIAELMQRP